VWASSTAEWPAADGATAVLKLIRALVGAKSAGDPAPRTQAPGLPPATVLVPGAPEFDMAAHLASANGLPVLDWAAVRQWVMSLRDEQAQALAWTACELAWLAHFRAALGPGYRVTQEGSAVLLSSLERNVAQATLAFVGKTLQRVLRVLDGVARVQPWGHDILVVFDDDETYYRYVAHYYPEAGDFAGSGGMFINHGCGHFATVKADLRSIEPVIAHELTHACLSHLPLPAWLNEGLAVNTEHRLCPPPSNVFGGRDNPQQMHARHRGFWGAVEIQEFWSGKSFLRADEGNELSYDLARIIVAQLAADWTRFRPFALAADMADAGAAAAREHLGVELGAVAAALLQQPPGAQWSPEPRLWTTAPERGAFQ
jgi:hypothetical protein